MSESAYTMDFIFETNCADEPGSMRVSIMSPDRHVRITAVIEVSHGVSIRQNITSILTVLQRDLFDKINIDSRSENESAIYFKVDSDSGNEFEPGYVLLSQKGGRIGYTSVKDVEY